MVFIYRPTIEGESILHFVMKEQCIIFDGKGFPNLSGKTLMEMESLFTEKCNRSHNVKRANAAFEFVKKMEIGHHVFIQDSKRKSRFYVAVVAGPYEYVEDEKTGLLCHRRTIKMIDTDAPSIRMNQLPQAVRKMMYQGVCVINIERYIGDLIISIQTGNYRNYYLEAVIKKAIEELIMSKDEEKLYQAAILAQKLLNK